MQHRLQVPNATPSAQSTFHCNCPVQQPELFSANWTPVQFNGDQFFSTIQPTARPNQPTLTEAAQCNIQCSFLPSASAHCNLTKTKSNLHYNTIQEQGQANQHPVQLPSATQLNQHPVPVLSAQALCTSQCRTTHPTSRALCSVHPNSSSTLCSLSSVLLNQHPPVQSTGVSLIWVQLYLISWLRLLSHLWSWLALNNKLPPKLNNKLRTNCLSNFCALSFLNYIGWSDPSFENSVFDSVSQKIWIHDKHLKCGLLLVVK